MRLASVGRAIVEGSLLLALLGMGAGCEKEDPAARLLAQGDVMLKAGQYVKAAERYAQATEASPRDEKLWERRAFALMNAGRLDEAVEALLRTRELKPDAAGQAELLRNVASLYLQSGTPLRAEQYLLEAVALEPRDAASLMWLAELESARGGARSVKEEPRLEHLERALGYYDRILAAEPDSLLATVNKRIVVMKLIRYQQQQRLTAEQVLGTLRERARRAEAQARLAATQQTLEELEGRSTLLRERVRELQKQGKTLKR
jgi:tetratricopeptide (TPR) repeat protein